MKFDYMRVLASLCWASVLALVGFLVFGTVSIAQFVTAALACILAGLFSISASDSPMRPRKKLSDSDMVVTIGDQVYSEQKGNLKFVFTNGKTYVHIEPKDLPKGQKS